MGKRGSNREALARGRAVASANARARTHCKNGHQRTLYNVYTVKYGGYLTFRCKDCAQASAKRRDTNPNLPEHTIRRIIECAENGLTLHRIAGWEGKRYVGGRVVNTHRLRLFCREQPKLGKRILAMFEKNRIEARKSQRIIVAPAVLRNDGADAVAAATQACEHIADRNMRHEIAADMMFAMSMGEFKPSEAASKVKLYIARWWKANDRSVMSKFGNVSLDAPMFDDETGDQYDRLTEDRRLWA